MALGRDQVPRSGDVRAHTVGTLLDRT